MKVPGTCMKRRERREIGESHGNDSPIIRGQMSYERAKPALMSPTDPPSTDRRARTAPETLPALADRFGSVTTHLLSPVRAAAFWLAVLMPLTYLPLLASGQIAERPTAFVLLVTLNAVAFVLGHSHRSPA